MELFVWTDSENKEMRKSYQSGLRRLLSLGGRAPADATTVLSGLECCILDWRVRRVALLLRLLNSAPGSLQHVALATLLLLKSEWVSVALQDMQLVLTNVHLRIGTSPYGPFVSSTCCWGDAGERLSAQPRELPFNDFGVLGRRCRTPLKHRHKEDERRAMRTHIRRNTKQLRMCFHREANSQFSTRIGDRSSEDPFGKPLLLAAKLCSHDPPLHTCLDWISQPLHRSAVAATFASDIFLARYSGNYFAKKFIPQSANHLRDADQLDLIQSVCAFHAGTSVANLSPRGKVTSFWSAPSMTRRV